MEFDIKKQAFWVVLGGLLVVYIAIFAVVIVPMSDTVEDKKKASETYVRQLQSTANRVQGASVVAVPERIAMAKAYRESLKQELTNTLAFYAERDKTIENVSFGYDGLDRAIGFFKNDKSEQNLAQVKNQMNLFFDDVHFKDVAAAFRGDAAAKKRVFVGDLKYEVTRGGGPWGAAGPDRPIQEIIKGLTGEPSSIQSMDDINVLTKSFVITKAFLEIIGQAPTMKLLQLEVVAKRGDAALSPDLIRNPYLEVKGDPTADPQSWRYSPAFLVKLQVHIRYQDAIELLNRALEGKAKVKLGGEKEHDVQLTTLLRNVRLAKELADPKGAEPIKILGQDLKDQTMAAREEKLNAIKREAVSGLTQPITLYADIYVFDFVDIEKAKLVLEGTPPAGGQN